MDVRKTIIILIILIFGSKVYSSDPEFSQFYSNRLYLNPAFAGVSDFKRIMLSYRNEWYGLESAFSTISFSYDRYAKSVNGGLGFLVMNDRQYKGIYNRISFDGIYSYVFQMSRYLIVSAGIQASLIQKSFRAGQIVLPHQINPITGIDPSETNNLTNLNNFSYDFSSGIAGSYKNNYFGVAVHHLTQPKEGFGGNYKLPRKYTAHFGTTIDIYKRGLIKPRYSISPNVLYQYQSGHQINYGMYFTFKDVSFGTWIRQNLGIQFYDAIFLIGYNQSIYRIAYSYDYSLTGISKNIQYSGTHEVTLQYNLEYKEKRKIEAIKCPEF
ncbi:PorP/SprF family type IX secretion system membrane protein [Bacteroidota bacterium]